MQWVFALLECCNRRQILVESAVELVCEQKKAWQISISNCRKNFSKKTGGDPQRGRNFLLTLFFHLGFFSKDRGAGTWSREVQRGGARNRTHNSVFPGGQCRP